MTTRGLSVIVAKNRRGPMGECQIIRQGAFVRVVSQRLES